MPNMLEQAIIDANNLKEAALKNAEQAIVEKYSSKIKEAVENILEQDEFETDDEELDMDVGMKDDVESSNIVDVIPLAGAEGEKLCPCPDDEEEIEIDFDDLERQMANPDETEPGAIDRETFADDEIENELPLGESIEKDLEEQEEKINEDDDMELDEEELKELAEELTVDLDVVPNGVQGANKGEVAYAKEMALAKENEDKMKKEIEELKSSIKELEESRDKKEEELNLSLQENKKLRTYLFSFKDKMNEINLLNAKLLYKNRVLNSNSLNERQKKTIVEAIDKSDSVENAKTIFETLKSTVVGTASSNNAQALPKSLREAIEMRKGTSIMRSSSSRNNEDNAIANDPNLLRMQKLAGIK